MIKYNVYARHEACLHVLRPTNVGMRARWPEEI